MNTAHIDISGACRNRLARAQKWFIRVMPGETILVRLIEWNFASDNVGGSASSWNDCTEWAPDSSRGKTSTKIYGVGGLPANPSSDIAVDRSDQRRQARWGVEATRLTELSVVDTKTFRSTRYFSHPGAFTLLRSGKGSFLRADVTTPFRH